MQGSHSSVAVRFLGPDQASALESTPVGYLELTPRWDILEADRAAADLLATPSVDLRGRSFAAALAPGMDDTLESVFLAGSPTWDQRTWFVRKSNARMMRVVAEPRRDVDGGVLGVVCMITELGADAPATEPEPRSLRLW